jgi:anti-sigma factor RsiW
VRALSCEEVRERAAEVALDVLPGDERAEVLAHLSTCPSCQALVDELAAAADRLLLALPEAEPPPGFAERTLAAMRDEGARDATPWWRTRLVVLAAAAVLVVVAAVGGLVLAQRDQGSGPAFSVALAAPGGGDVGQLTLSDDDPPWITMSIDRGEGTHTYTCVLDLNDGTTVTIGPLHVDDGVGTWGRSLPLDPALVRTARVVDDRGTTVAWAPLS